MRKIFALLFFGLGSMLAGIRTNAQISLWVGETYTCDAAGAVMGLTSDISWSSSGGISMTGTGFYRDVKFNTYVGGTTYVTCSWKYRMFSNDSYHSQSKTWSITCRDNQVSISPTSVQIAVGETYNLSYRHQFDNQYTHNANAYFYVSGSVVSVTRSGQVKGLNVGTAYVNVYSDISSVTPYCKITVVEPVPTGVSLSDSEIALTVNDTKRLSATMIPSSISSSYVWTSENPSVATVDNGLVTAVSKGTTRIKVTSIKGNFSAYCKVVVKNPPIPPTFVSLPKNISIIKGFASSISPTLSPSGAETSFTWKSDNTAVISINSVTGKLTGNSIGTANITVTTANGLSDTCEVSVVEAPEGIDIQTVILRMNEMSSLTDWTIKYL